MSVNLPARSATGLLTAIEDLRRDFPALTLEHNGRKLVYLDSAASAQVPQPVLDCIAAQQGLNHANVHRGVHTLSERATAAYESARKTAARYLNAGSSDGIIFTRGTTESINLVASSLGSMALKAGDEILLSGMEHHSNIVPWQLAAARTGARIVVAPLTERGEIDRKAFAERLNKKTRIVGLAHVSNALGTINPIRELVSEARKVGAYTVVDGAQAMAHMRVDVAELGCDFYALSGHKMFAGTGIGLLFGRTEILDAMPPYQGGGEMILTVNFDKSVYNALPYKFEAGTPNITGAVALGAAIDYLERIDPDALAAHEHDLLEYGTASLTAISGLTMIGTAAAKAGVLSFVLDDIHAHDIGTIVNSEGVAIRTGHHCAMPVMEFFGVPATARASLALYNNRDDIDRLVAGLHKAREVFS
jgi:cysteine desulfurase/selenocysteine lyase